MFEALFGSEMPLAARFFIAFLVVLGLIVYGALRMMKNSSLLFMTS